jgi:hypothetical protein
MRKCPKLMDLGGEAPIDVNTLVAMEVVTRTTFGPRAPRRGTGRSSVVRRYELLIYAEGRHLNLFDVENEQELWHGDGGDDECVDALLQRFGDAVLLIGTVEAAPVPLVVELRDDPPGDDEDLGRWDHVAQADVDLPSGRLAVADEFGSRPLAEIPVARGRHRARIYYGDLDISRSVPGNPRRFYDRGHHYRVALWPVAEADVAAPVVLKRWAGIDALPAPEVEGDEASTLPEVDG